MRSTSRSLRMSLTINSCSMQACGVCRGWPQSKKCHSSATESPTCSTMTTMNHQSKALNCKLMLWLQAPGIMTGLRSCLLGSRWKIWCILNDLMLTRILLSRRWTQWTMLISQWCIQRFKDWSGIRIICRSTWKSSWSKTLSFRRSAKTREPRGRMTKNNKCLWTSIRVHSGS